MIILVNPLNIYYPPDVKVIAILQYIFRWDKYTENQKKIYSPLFLKIALRRTKSPHRTSSTRQSTLRGKTEEKCCVC